MYYDILPKVVKIIEKTMEAGVGGWVIKLIFENFVWFDIYALS
jgi:hypothetical protein